MNSPRHTAYQSADTLHLIRRVPWCIAFATVAAAAATADPQVTITGGADISGYEYAWTITHQNSAPLVYVEIPHFRADVFYAPDGWTAEIINQNSLDYKPGKCIAKTLENSPGLSAGRSGEFTMSLNPAGAPASTGRITLRFADGTETSVTAEIPAKPSTMEQWATPVGLGAIFGVFLLVRAIRAKSRLRRPDREHP